MSNSRTSSPIAYNEEGIKAENKKGDKMVLIFDYAPKLIESRKVGLPLKAPFLFFAFNLMLCVRAIHRRSYEALHLFHFLFCGEVFNSSILKINIQWI